MTPPDPTPGDWRLHDIQRVVGEVLSQHGNLLSIEEVGVARELLALTGAEGRLWARLVGRVSEVFDAQAFEYSDVPHPVQAARALVGLGLAEQVLEPEERLGCMRADQLRDLCRAYGLPTRGVKAALVARLLDTAGLPESLIIRLRHKRLFQRFELLCFRRVGRSHADLVLERIGHERWPAYATTTAFPLFPSRDALLRFESLLSGSHEQSTTELLKAWSRIGPRESWLSHLDPRMLLQKELTNRARELERNRLFEEAAQVYARLLAGSMRNPGPWVRRLALCLERQGETAQGSALCAAWRSRVGLTGRLELERTGRRLARKAKRSWRPAPPPIPPTRREVRLAGGRRRDGRWVWKGGQSVEATVIAQVRPRTAFYGENGLWKTLFSLCFYDLYWLPSPGMLPVPGLSGPLDLGTPAFMEARTEAVLERLTEIGEGNVLAVLERGLRHRGERVRWVNWELASDAMLRRIVVGVGGRLLRHIFCRILRVGREACCGFPDLFVLDGEPQRVSGAFPSVLGSGVVFVEVKGPGDTLSGAQQAWIDYLLQGDAQVEVWHVRQEEGAAPWESSSQGVGFEVADCQAG
ncbi:MAG: VRR-NUC domain-containing protein [Myxococcota bacterium]|nr:VRR-NUC domain-containing protein [Myxococcota bacterium]